MKLFRLCPYILIGAVLVWAACGAWLIGILFVWVMQVLHP